MTGDSQSNNDNDRTEYSLRSKVPICGTYDGNKNPIVELGVIETVPEGKVILDDTPTSDEEYQRKARTGLTIEQTREVASALNGMANRMENNSD